MKQGTNLLPRRLAACTATAATLFALAMPGYADAQTFKIGIISLLSGPAAESFGTPNVNAAKLLVEKLNKGEVPAPYNKKGIAGVPIEIILLDEAGGPAKMLDGFRNFVQRDNVDAVIGPISSGNCLALAPVAEQLKKFTILSDCGTPRVFEEASYKYVFRAGAHGAMDNIALAKYLIEEKVTVRTISSIQQDYAYGKDNWLDFKTALHGMVPSAEIKSELWPKFGAGQYGAEISALLRDGADVVQTSLWGGDLQAFVLQAAPRGIFKKSTFALTAAAHVLPKMGNKMPDGVIMGERGTVGYFAKSSPLNDWFIKSYQDAYKEFPASASAYRLAQSLLGLKAAAEKIATAGQKPSSEQLAQAMEGLEWDTPSGRIRMALGNGHQAIQDAAIGITKWDEKSKAVVMTRIRYYPAECVNPPAGVKSVEWIKDGMKGARCSD